MIEFSHFRVREIGETGAEHLYPLADDRGQSIQLSDRDGAGVKRCTAIAIRVDHVGKSGKHSRLDLDLIKAEVIVTDARVAIAVPRYDKGGGWVGGSLSALFNTVSKIRASLVTSRTCLVGHVDYAWLAQVSYKAEYSIFDNRKFDVLSLGYFTLVQGKNLLVQIELELAQDVDSRKLAEWILGKAVRARLASWDVRPEDAPDEEVRRELEEALAQGLPNEPSKDKWTGVKLAGYLPATFNTFR